DGLLGRGVRAATSLGNTGMTQPIEATDLRIGMFVHLNVGWMSHPFPLSSFKISSTEQIETIRSLGLRKMTWSPERSDPEADPGAPGALPGDGTAVRPDAPAIDHEGADEAADEAAAGAPAESAPIDPRAAARLALAHQRETAQRCERQFGEACKD